MYYGRCANLHATAGTCNNGTSNAPQGATLSYTPQMAVTTANCSNLHDPAGPCLLDGSEAGKLPNSRPDTQVDYGTTPKTGRKTAISTPCGPLMGHDALFKTPADSDLSRIVEVWASLPLHVRQAVILLVKAGTT